MVIFFLSTYNIEFLYNIQSPISIEGINIFRILLLNFYPLISSYSECTNHTSKTRHFISLHMKIHIMANTKRV